MDAGIGWPLLPAHLLSPPLLATTETTWLPVSDSTGCPHHPTAAATHSLYHVPAPALLCPQGVRDTQLWLGRFQCLEQGEVEPTCNLSLCWLKNTKQTLDCALLCTHLDTRRQRWSNRYSCLSDCRAFGTNAGVPKETQQRLGKHSRWTAKTDLLQ